MDFQGVAQPETIINRFTNTKHPAAFSSINRVQTNVEHDGYKTNKKDVMSALSSQPSYVRQRIAFRRFPRRKVIATSMDEWWQADTLYMKDFAVNNKQHAYCLVVIDVFSRFVFAEPLKTLTAKESAEAFGRILVRTQRKPKLLYTDDGNEYKGAFLSLLKKHDIRKVVARSWVKASMVERANRTLKERIMRYMQHSYKYKWTVQLQAIVDDINNSVNRSIGTRPNLINYFNQHKLFYRQLGAPSFRHMRKSRAIKFKFFVGQRVVHVLRDRVFRRGYDRNWTIEEFIINKRFATSPPTYQLKRSILDPNNNTDVLLNSRWYEHQLQPVDIGNRIAEVEVLSERGRGRNKQLLVHYLIEPEYSKHWIKASLLTSTNETTNR